MEGWWTVEEAASVWGVTPSWVRKLLKGSRVTGAVRHGRDWGIPQGTPSPARPRPGRPPKAPAEA